MKKAVLLIITIAFCINSCSEKSEFSEIEKLVTTAKIWGFLKYYHPQVADGKYNWDEQLFEILPKVRKASNKEELSKIYIEWIDNLGNVLECKNCNKEQTYQYFLKNLNLDWIVDENIFTIQLSEKLKYIELNRHQGEKYYVSSGEVGNIDIQNEKSYNDFNWTDEDLRILTLFRYWNIIEYFFPYKYQTDTNWNDVLNKMIPKFLNPKSETDFHLAMLELVVSIDDGHSYLSTKFTKAFFGINYIPTDVKIINDKAVVRWFYSDSLAKINDLRIGDVISKVNDISISSIFTEKKKYVQGSNLNTRKAFSQQHSIFNGSSDSVKIEYSRNNHIKTKNIGRYPMRNFDFKWSETGKFKILENNIGYLNLEELKVDDVSEAMHYLSKTKAIIIDIRNYPSGTLYSLAKYISSKKNDFYKATYPDLDYPGGFIWRKGNQCGENGILKYKGKVILLVNELTQSHVEFTTMCLQTGDNVTTIGSQTSGADGNVSNFKMVGGFNTSISGIGIFYPDGTETQRKGVKIDIEIKPTINGIKNGKDEVLEKAIEFIKS